MLFENVLFIDDPLNASAVHLAAGGSTYMTFKAHPDYAGAGKANSLAIKSTSWSCTVPGPPSRPVPCLSPSRPWVGWFEEEMDGADLTHHGGKAYPMDDAHMTVGGNSSDSNEAT